MKKPILSLRKPASMLLAGFTLVALLFSSCSKNELDDLMPPVVNKTGSLPGDQASKNDGSNQMTPTIPADAMISISHGPCFGMCPSYSVSVSKEGVVVYNGYNNVGVTGSVTFRIERSLAYELGQNMEKGGFFSFQDNYPVIPDGQRNVTSLYFDGKLKVVTDYGIGVPSELTSMRMMVEKALQIDRFISGQANPSLVLTGK